jgi:hypothetical protein
MLRDNYLVGLTFVNDQGKPYPDSWYLQKLATAISNFEHYTQLTLVAQEIKGEAHDYYIRDYEQYAFIQLYQYPVIVRQDTPVVRAMYPTGQVITTFPREWVRTDNVHGQIQLIPTQGTLSQVILGQGGSYLPVIYQGLGYLPQLFQVDYVAGFETGNIPTMFLDAVAKLASIELLSSIGDSVRPAGVTSQSLGVDGLSESRGFVTSPDFAPVFSGRISQYRKELFGDPRISLKGILPQIKDFYRGINMWVSGSGGG